MPERALGIETITAYGMTADVLEDYGDAVASSGTFTFNDHSEGITACDPWVARGRRTHNSFDWEVSRPEPEPSETCFRNSDGEPVLCPIECVDLGIKAFIAERLALLVPVLRAKGAEGFELLDEPPKFQGDIFCYTGQCLCKTIEGSDLMHPFDWLANTNGGQYPANCFACSCGKRWFLDDPKRGKWYPVGDDEAWSGLLEFNGFPMELMHFHPSKRPFALYLVRNLRSEGFVPLPLAH